MTTTTTAVELTYEERFTVALMRAGMSLTEFAEYVGVARKTLWRYATLRDEPRASVLRVLATESGFGFDWLRPSPDELEEGRSLVHPPGLEPGTHWLRAWDVVGAAEALLIEAVAL